MQPRTKDPIPQSSPSELVAVLVLDLVVDPPLLSANWSSYFSKVLVSARVVIAGCWNLVASAKCRASVTSVSLASLFCMCNN